jgi:hypothetical protein
MITPVRSKQLTKNIYSTGAVARPATGDYGTAWLGDERKQA